MSVRGSQSENKVGECSKPSPVIAEIKMQFCWNAVAPDDIKVAQTIKSFEDAVNVVKDALWASFIRSRVSVHVGTAQNKEEMSESTIQAATLG